MITPLDTLMTNKSDAELEVYLIDIKKYDSTTVKAALTELQKRGKEFTSLQLEYIESYLKTKVQEEKLPGSTKSRYTRYIVTDPNAPAFYSQTAIMAFSILFTVIFGAILLSINIRDKKGKWIVIGFGILFTLGLIALSTFITLTTPLLIGLNAIGGSILTEVLWEKYLGKTTFHRAKPIWIPLLISLLITIPLILFTIYSEGF